MNPIPVVVLPEVGEFSFKVLSIPKEGIVKVFIAIRSDHSLDKEMYAGRPGSKWLY